MNRILIILVLFISSMSAYGATENSDTAIVGDWQLESKGIIYDISFQNDGVFKGRVSRQEKTLWVCAGKWTIKGDRLHYTYTESSLKTIPAGAVDEDELLRVTPVFYETKNRAGETNRYVRRQKGEPNRVAGSD